MPSRYWTTAAGLIALVFAAVVWYGRTAPQPVPLELGDPGRSAPESITVHVAGEVQSPGLVQVAAEARVADVVAAAGGSTRRADLSRLNLAAPVTDGQQVVVPGLRSDAAETGAAVADDGKVKVNQATVGELESLPGVGPVLAARIAAHRDEHGPFAVVEDLLDVPGIGEGKLETLRDSVVLP